MIVVGAEVIRDEHLLPFQCCDVILFDLGEGD